MRFTLPRAAFLAALTQVKAVVERRTTIPILANVLITTTTTQVTLKATDLDMEVLCSLEARGDVLPGAVTVPAVMLTDIVRKMPDKADVTLELTARWQRRPRRRRAREDEPSLPAGFRLSRYRRRRVSDPIRACR
jgi:DNA polymerase-3 subunit beta